MKATHSHYTKLLNGTCQFVIPVFQRDYSWTELSCEQLWRDVLRIGGDSSGREHFLGSVVYIGTGDTSASFHRWLLIDGQQRVTTLTLLVAALRDHIRESGWAGGPDAPTARRLETHYLINAEEEGDRRYKLRLRRHDDATLRAIVDGTERPTSVSERLLESYEWFRDQVRDADPSVVMSGINRLIIVDVGLDRGADDPQLVFESLNSTGIDLSQADLIRNFVLMRLPEREQTQLYESHWQKIESLFRGSEHAFDDAMRDYLALKSAASKQERADKIYFSFRRQFAGTVGDAGELRALLDEMLRFSRYHAAFSLGASAPTSIREPLARLRRLVDVPAILVMRLFECHEVHRTLGAEDFVRALEMIESYIVRRAVGGEQSRGYWQVFANLAYQLETARPLQSLAVGLARLRGTYAFPSDQAFADELRERDLYGKRICRDLLERLENFDTREPTATDSLTIEHILPQNERLPIEWQQMLGEGWQEEQRRWKHRLGNLTLTAYNGEYSDRPFAEKKSIPGGFNESAVRLNKFVREQARWTADEIRSRGELLVQLSLRAWSGLPVTAAMIDAADRAELQRRAQRREVDSVEMTDVARQLFGVLRARITENFPGHIEMAERKSICYYDSEFFLEVLPRRNRLQLLLPQEYAVVSNPPAIAEDAREWAYFRNARHSGGVVLKINSVDDIAAAIPLIQQARALAGS